MAIAFYIIASISGILIPRFFGYWIATFPQQSCPAFQLLPLKKMVVQTERRVAFLFLSFEWVFNNSTTGLQSKMPATVEKKQVKLFKAPSKSLPQGIRSLCHVQLDLILFHLEISQYLGLLTCCAFLASLSPLNATAGLSLLWGIFSSSESTVMWQRIAWTTLCSYF